MQLLDAGDVRMSTIFVIVTIPSLFRELSVIESQSPMPIIQNNQPSILYNPTDGGYLLILTRGERLKIYPATNQFYRQNVTYRLLLHFEFQIWFRF